MARIEFKTGTPGVTQAQRNARRSVDELLGGDGPSPRGSSYYRSVMICPREHALRYEYGVESEGSSDALATGSVFHKGMEVYYRTIMAHQQAIDAAGGPRDDHYYFGAQMDAQKAAWTAIGVIANEPGYEEVYATASRLMEAYFERYWNMDRWRVVAVEETLRVTDGGFDYSARLDLLVEWNGRLWIVEHKTAKSVSVDSLDHYDMDIQTLGQQWLLERCVDLSQFEPLAGILVNITTKHKTPQFFRKEVCPSNAHLGMFEEAVGGLITLRAGMKRLNWPRFLGHCSGIARGYSKCQYFDPCRNWPSWTAQQIAANPPEGFVVRPQEAA